MSTRKKASNLLTPYPIRRNYDGTINFTTEEGVTYIAAFPDASYHFEGITGVYEFNIYPDREPEKHDQRIGLTIVYILEVFFQDSEHVLLYVCESLDNRHFARKRKFDGWFETYGRLAFEKYDYELHVEDTQILISLILKRGNPHQQLLVTAFQKTYALYISYK